MNIKFIGAFLIICGGTAYAEDSYLASIRAQAKFPDTVVVSDVIKYLDSTICGRWNAKDSYGLFVGLSDFVYREKGLLNEEARGNPYCTNLKNKEIAHAVWVRLNNSKEQRAKLSQEIANIDREYKNYCFNYVIKSLCDPASDKRKNKMPELQSALALADEVIADTARELDSLISIPR